MDGTALFVPLHHDNDRLATGNRKIHRRISPYIDKITAKWRIIPQLGCKNLLNMFTQVSERRDILPHAVTQNSACSFNSPQGHEAV